MDQANESLEAEELLAHAGWVRALAVALVGESKADDLTQQTMLRAIERPPRHRSNLKGWLGTIARNFAISAARKDLRQKELLGKRVYEDRRDRDSAADPRVVPETPEQLLGKTEAAEQLMQVLRDLPDPGRHLLMLRYFENLTPAEIARRYDMKAVTVRVQISRALEELRRLMRRRFGGDGMTPCRVLLAPLPAPWAVPTASSPAWLMPAATAAGLLTITLAGVYLWDQSEAPPVDSEMGVSAVLPTDESERDSAAGLAAEAGVSDASRTARAPVFALNVVDEQGAPIQGARLRLHRDGRSVGHGATDAEGQIDRDQALGAGVLQLSVLDHTPELRDGAWGPGSHRWVLPEREQVQGKVEGAGEAAGNGLFLALIGDEPLFREGAPEWELFGSIDQRYASFRRFLVSVREGGEFRFAGLPAGWSGYLTSADPRFRLDDAGLDAEADGRLRITAPAKDLRVRLVARPRITARVLPAAGASLSSLRDGVAALMLSDGVLRVPLDETGCFEVLADPAALDGLEVRVHAPQGGGGGAFAFAQVPADGDLGALRLDPLPTARLRVVDEAGAPLAGALVGGAPSTWFPEAAEGAHARAAADGLVDLALPSDWEGLRVRAPGFVPRRIDRAEFLARRSAAAAGEAVEIVLTRAAPLRVSLVGPTGPLPLGAATNLEVHLEAEQGLLTGDPTLDRDFTPGRGTLLASAIGPRGLVSASLQPGLGNEVVLEGIRSGVPLHLEVRTRTGQRLLARTLAPLAGDGPHEIELILPRAPRSLSGRVVGPDGRSIDEARVSLGPASSDGSEGVWISTRSDLQGRFRFPAVWSDRVDLRVVAGGFAAYAEADRALPGVGDELLLRLEQGRAVVLGAVDTSGRPVMPTQGTARFADGRVFRGLPGPDHAVEIGGLPFREAQFELLVDGWVYAHVAGPQEAGWTLRLPPRGLLPVPDEGWEATAGAAGPPQLILRGSDSEQRIALVPHPDHPGRWTLAQPVLLPVGTWELEAPGAAARTLQIDA